MKEEITEKKGTLSSLWIVQRVIAVLAIIMAFFPIANPAKIWFWLVTRFHYLHQLFLITVLLVTVREHFV